LIAFSADRILVMEVRSLRRFIAVLLVVVACAVVVSEPASASERLSKSDAHRAVSHKIDGTMSVAVGGRVNTWGVNHCFRRGPSRFMCRAVAFDDVKPGTFKCLLTYTVRSSGGRTNAKLRKKRCGKYRTPFLSRARALDAARSEGNRRAVYDEVSIESLIREGPDSFSATARWERFTGSDFEECTVGIGIVLTESRVKAESDPHIECESLGYDPGFQTGPGPKYCPGFGPRIWDAKPEIEGKTLAEATVIAEAHECEVRVIRQDGVSQVVTADLRYDRLDVAVEGPEQRITEVVGVF
jgi:hypothetical protein